MFKLFEGITTKTYLIIIASLLVMCFGLWKLYSNNLVENGVLVEQNGNLAQTVEYKDKSAAITDKVVAEHVANSNKTQVTAEKIRKEALNDYINKLEKVEQPKVPTKDAQSDGADRVAELTRRMWESFCNSYPTDTRCNPSSPPR